LLPSDSAALRRLVAHKGPDYDALASRVKAHHDASGRED
jgi:hypothetical protein